MFWQFEVEGAPDSVRDFYKAVNDSVKEFQEQTRDTKIKVFKVRNLIRGIKTNIAMSGGLLPSVIGSISREQNAEQPVAHATNHGQGHSTGRGIAG